MSLSVADKRIAECRKALKRLGNRRKKITVDEEALRKDTERELRKVKEEKIIPVAEAARLAGLNRSTVYELYLGEENGSAPRSTESRK